MKILRLKEFFNKIDYNWKKDEEQIKTICHYTKTRVNPNIIKVTLRWGMEQTFLIKAVAEWLRAEYFFEIGTGRGTACYALSLIPSIKEIHTVDILNYYQKFSTAIGYKPVNVSLADIRNMIPFKEKSKIRFHHRKGCGKLRAEMPNKFDLAFIDGDHTNKVVIMEDYAICQDLLKNDGIILFDDYDPNRFAVKEIVEKLLEKDKSLDAVLIEQRGHLFENKPIEHGKGIILMKRGNIF